MLRNRAAAVFFAPAALLAIACTVETREVVSQPSPTLPATSADGGVRSKPTGASCQAYLACVAEVTPEAIGSATDEVGSTSACWRGNVAEAENCEAGCDAALTKCRRASCPLKPTTACGSCCQDSLPDGTKAVRAHYYAGLEDVGATLSACSRECADPGTEACRACVVKYGGASDARDACTADAKCKPMLDCLDTCGGVDRFLNLE